MRFSGVCLTAGLDDPAVVAARADGIERRLRTAEKLALQSWLATLSRPRSPDRP